MRKLYTVAFPQLAASERAFIEAYRREHDPMAQLIAAHFTLVFATTAVPERDYLEHVATVASTCEPIGFVCQRATIGENERGKAVHVFLVPEAGRSAISVLHDRLYAGPPESELLSDVPFVPHVTIGTTARGSDAKSLCDAWNRHSPRIAGLLREATVVALDSGDLETLGTFRLAASV